MCAVLILILAYLCVCVCVVIASHSHNTGVLIYEMVAGFAPFSSDDPMEVYQLIIHGDYAFPSQFSRSCCSLIDKLLVCEEWRVFRVSCVCVYVCYGDGS
jgi:hypothetical protein